jgi:hypothetical protein
MDITRFSFEFFKFIGSQSCNRAAQLFYIFNSYLFYIFNSKSPVVLVYALDSPSGLVWRAAPSLASDLGRSAQDCEAPAARIRIVFPARSADAMSRGPSGSEPQPVRLRPPRASFPTKPDKQAAVQRRRSSGHGVGLARGLNPSLY